MEGHLRDIAHVDRGGWQGRAGARAAAQPLVGRRVSNHGTRPDDAHAGVRRAVVHDRVRLHRPSPRDSRVGRNDADARAGAAVGRRLLRGGHGCAARDEAAREDLADAVRNPVADSIRRGHGSPRIRPGLRQPRLAHPGAGRARVERQSLSVCREMQPGAFLLGRFDVAVTRFSGRLAPPREGPAFMRDAYSHEVISHGFWPGSGPVLEPAFYAYAVPEPSGLKEAAVQPAEAYYHRELGEFILPYEAVRAAGDPDRAIRLFVDSTYERAATLGRWDRAGLEAQPLTSGR